MFVFEPILIRKGLGSEDVQQWIQDQCKFENNRFETCKEKNSMLTRREKNKVCSSHYRMYYACIENKEKMIIQEKTYVFYQNTREHKSTFGIDTSPRYINGTYERSTEYM